MTSRAELASIGLELFFARGFDETTVDDIAAAAGIGRRTFFRYFASKNDVPWGDFDGLIDQLRARLAALPPDAPLLPSLRAAVLEFNRFPDSEIAHHRERMSLLLNVPSLIAHSTLRFAAWREAVAEFVSARTGAPADGLLPRTVAFTYLGVSVAAYEQWLHEKGSSLPALLESALDSLGDVFPALRRS